MTSLIVLKASFIIFKFLTIRNTAVPVRSDINNLRFSNTKTIGSKRTVNATAKTPPTTLPRLLISLVAVDVLFARSVKVDVRPPSPIATMNSALASFMFDIAPDKVLSLSSRAVGNVSLPIVLR